MNEHQGTTAWHADRCGKITASGLADCLLVTPEKYKVVRDSGTTLAGGVHDNEQSALEMLEAANAKKPGHSMVIVPAAPLKGFQEYMAVLVCERLTGQPAETPDTYAMKWGHDHEDYAARAYENRTGRLIEATGFTLAPASTGLATFGASPDGLVGTDGLAEIKCPVNSTRHLRCFIEGIPDEHWPQLEGQLLATGRAWVDFISYDPRFVGEWEHLGLYVARYTSKPDLLDQCLQGICRMEAAIKSFIRALPKKGDL